jgi:hypothetical protein
MNREVPPPFEFGLPEVPRTRHPIRAWPWGVIAAAEIVVAATCGIVVMAILTGAGLAAIVAMLRWSPARKS